MCPPVYHKMYSTSVHHVPKCMSSHKGVVVICLSIHLYLSINLSIYLSKYLPTNVPTNLVTYPQCQPTYQPTYVPTYQPTYLPAYVATCLPLLHLFYCRQKRNSEIFISSVYFLDAPKSQAENIYVHELFSEVNFSKLMATVGFKCFINKLEVVTQYC